MRNLLKIQPINYEDNGTKIVYGYTYSKGISKFFNSKNPFFVSYNDDVSNIPNSIAVIPFLANVVPIAWFAGFDIEVDELDKDFKESLEQIKEVFSKTYPHILNLKSELRVKKVIENKKTGNKKAMLFSGGVDAYATYFRYNDSYTPLELFTIHGADVALDDFNQWNSVVLLNEKEHLLKSNNKHYITTNLRDFYTYQVGLLLEDLSWWGRVQHGLALTGVTAPLAYINGIDLIYIGSTHTKNIEIPWGSSPYTDNLIKWGGTKVVHDAYELERLDKIELIIKGLLIENKAIKLRVCYSELNKGTNCSKCEKCLRTMFAIILFNGNPNNYGFDTDASIYSAIQNILKKDFHTKGIYYHWTQLIEKAKVTETFFVFNNEELENSQMEIIKNTKLELFESEQARPLTKKARNKYILRNKFAGLYKVYLKIKQQ